MSVPDYKHIIKETDNEGNITYRVNGKFWWIPKKEVENIEKVQKIVNDIVNKQLKKLYVLQK